MLTALQLRPEFEIVVDLAIEGDPNRPVFIGHRLAAVRREIDDAQATVTEADISSRLDPHTAVVRTAMAHRVAHLNQKLVCDRG